MFTRIRKCTWGFSDPIIQELSVFFFSLKGSIKLNVWLLFCSSDHRLHLYTELQWEEVHHLWCQWNFQSSQRKLWVFLCFFVCLLKCYLIYMFVSVSIVIFQWFLSWILLYRFLPLQKQVLDFTLTVVSRICFLAFRDTWVTVQLEKFIRWFKNIDWFNKDVDIYRWILGLDRVQIERQRIGCSWICNTFCPFWCKFSDLLLGVPISRFCWLILNAISKIIHSFYKGKKYNPGDEGTRNNIEHIAFSFSFLTWSLFPYFQFKFMSLKQHPEVYMYKK